MNNCTTTSQEERKQEQTKPHISGRKVIIKMRAEINEIETRKTAQNIQSTKNWFHEKIKTLS